MSSICVLLFHQVFPQFKNGNHILFVYERGLNSELRIILTMSWDGENFEEGRVHVIFSAL